MMIHIAIGTKAQFIKMAPLLRSLSQKEIPYNLIDMGQHALVTAALRKELGVREPDVFLGRKQNESSLLKLFYWAASVGFRSFPRERVKQEIFRGWGGVCLIHGEPLATLLALFLAKRAGLKVAHVEGGLFSFDYLNPFPEEILRNLIIRNSDIVFAPSQWAYDNLVAKGLGGKAVKLSANTSLEATLYSLSNPVPDLPDFKRYALLTFHRAENIFCSDRIRFLLKLLKTLTSRMQVVFIQDPPTIGRLKKTGLDRALASLPNLVCEPVCSHPRFIHLVNNSEFVVTDGGSIQEESYYLDKPCLLLRSRNERQEGLGENVLLSRFSFNAVEYFLAHYHQFRRKTSFDRNVRPSEEIIGYIMSMGR